jgi:Leucine-rich repeat (LRR) protein
MTPIRIFLNLKLRFLNKSISQSKRVKSFQVLFGILILLLSCRTSSHPEPKNLGEKYFPLDLVNELLGEGNVKYLELHDLEFKNSDLAKLPALPELEILSISRSNLTNLKIFTRSKYPNLYTIYANDTAIVDEDLMNWEDPPEITKFFINSTNVSQVEWTRQFPRLRQLNLEENKIQDISALKENRNLIEVWLGGTNVNTLDPLLGMDSLNYIGIDRLPISENDLENFQKQMKYVKLVRRSPIF